MRIQEILRNIRKADEDYHMIEKNDRIAVGVSGGKDSMVLLTALHMYAKFPAKRFEVVGIHIDLGFPDMDFRSVQAFCDENGIEFHSEPSKVYEILKKNRDADGKIKCSLCSKFKKATVIEAAKKYGCNKTAFGHHGDDAVETLLLNAIYGGRIATFKPKMYLTNTQMMFIRPLLYCHEDEINNALLNNAIPFVVSTCPNDGYTKRQDMKEMLLKLYQEYPSAKDNLLSMLSNHKQVELWKKESNPITYEFQPLSKQHALEIAEQWHYDKPYDFYDAEADPEDYAELVNEDLRESTYMEAICEKEFVGFFTYVQQENGIEIGIGLRPDLCGKHMGYEFLTQAEAYLYQQFHPRCFLLSVAAFNKRAIKLYSQCGYEITGTQMRNTNNDMYEFYNMVKYV